MIRAIVFFCTYLVHVQVARHLEHHITYEEQPCTKTVGRIAQTQLAVHLKLGDPDIGAIKECHEIADDDYREQAPGYLLVDPLLPSVRGFCGSILHQSVSIHLHHSISSDIHGPVRLPAAPARKDEHG
jgi:hypothetical protein